MAELPAELTLEAPRVRGEEKFGLGSRSRGMNGRLSTECRARNWGDCSAVPPMPQSSANPTPGLACSQIGVRQYQQPGNSELRILTLIANNNNGAQLNASMMGVSE